MITITKSLISEISGAAKKSPRKRTNYNFHSNLEEPLHRMLNAMELDTYVRPHKHENPDKLEIFIILTGTAVAVEFDDNGAIKAHVVLNRAHGVFGIEFMARTWHTIIPLESGTVLYEVKQGPYRKLTDKNFASWAPEEGTQAALAFNQSLLIKLKLTIS
jgi:cupin fold WbuC family metalloprotein